MQQGHAQSRDSVFRTGNPSCWAIPGVPGAPSAAQKWVQFSSRAPALPPPQQKASTLPPVRKNLHDCLQTVETQKTGGLSLGPLGSGCRPVLARGGPFGPREVFSVPARFLLFLLGQLPHGRLALLSWREALTLNLRSREPFPAVLQSTEVCPLLRGWVGYMVGGPPAPFDAQASSMRKHKMVVI